MPHPTQVLSIAALAVLPPYKSCQGLHITVQCLPKCLRDLQSARTLAWAEGNPHSEYQQEYYGKQLFRQQARRAQLRDAGGAQRGRSLISSLLSSPTVRSVG